MKTILIAAAEPFLTALLASGNAFGCPFRLVGDARFTSTTLAAVEPPLGAAFVVNPTESWSLRRLQRTVLDHTSTAVLATAFVRDGLAADDQSIARAAMRWLSSTPGVFVTDPLAWADGATNTTLPVDIEAPAAARRFVRGALTDWGRTDLVDTAMLLVSELTTNAVLHAGGSGIDIAVARSPHRDDGVHIAVGDDATGELPVWRRPTPASRSGRGLRIVDAASSRWGVTVDNGRKRVWCEIGGSGAKEEGHGSFGER